MGCGRPWTGVSKHPIGQAYPQGVSGTCRCRTPVGSRTDSEDTSHRVSCPVGTGLSPFKKTSSSASAKRRWVARRGFHVALPGIEASLLWSMMPRGPRPIAPAAMNEAREIPPFRCSTAHMKRLVSSPRRTGPAGRSPKETPCTSPRSRPSSSCCAPRRPTGRDGAAPTAPASPKTARRRRPGARRRTSASRWRSRARGCRRRSCGATSSTSPTAVQVGEPVVEESSGGGRGGRGGRGMSRVPPAEQEYLVMALSREDGSEALDADRRHVDAARRDAR